MKNLQKKIDEYNKKIHSKSGIGELYERQIRYLYEKSGWRVVPSLLYSNSSSCSIY